MIRRYMFYQNDKIAVLNVIDDDDEKVISNFINSYDIR